MDDTVGTTARANKIPNFERRTRASGHQSHKTLENRQEEYGAQIFDCIIYDYLGRYAVTVGGWNIYFILQGFSLIFRPARHHRSFGVIPNICPPGDY